MDTDIEATCSECEACQLTQNNPKVAPLHPWLQTEKPMQRMHIDYAGPVEGKMLFVAVCAYSKWVECIITNTATTSKTIGMLRDIFARLGIPNEIVSDNAACFTSSEFEDFMKCLGVTHTRGAPYHPATNGLAEWCVQTKENRYKLSNRD